MEHSETITHLKTLGLDVGAAPDDIRAAFRRLAKELHPDVTGQKSDFRFKLVTTAYNALKGLSAEDLAGLAESSPAYAQIRERRQRQEEEQRAAEKIDAILDKYEREMKDYCTSRPPDDQLDVKAAVLRMKSRNPKALRAVLKHSMHLANRVEFRKAVTEILTRPEVDEECAKVIASFPFDAMTRKLIAQDVSGNAGNLPAGLIISLAGSDTDAIESFLLHIKPEDYAALLRRWPSGKAMNPNITRKLLEADDARILVPLLSLIKTNFPQAAVHYRKRLVDLEAHPTAAVRAWAKKLV
ncbi:MAG: DnaJ domain-containing protein [Synergistaceae bacterium]|nr:DnaJ domain-containing protein [Synergistaceae bacterium]